MDKDEILEAYERSRRAGLDNLEFYLDLRRAGVVDHTLIIAGLAEGYYLVLGSNISFQESESAIAAAVASHRRMKARRSGVCDDEPTAAPRKMRVVHGHTRLRRVLEPMWVGFETRLRLETGASREQLRFGRHCYYAACIGLIERMTACGGDAKALGDLGEQIGDELAEYAEQIEPEAAAHEDEGKADAVR
jgi:hypothetical protein